MATTFVATAPDGTEITRTSKTRNYTHAVLVYSDDVEYVRDADGNYLREERFTEDGQRYEASVTRVTGQSWGQVSFNGSEALARKNADSWRKKGSFKKVIVVPVERR